MEAKWIKEVYYTSRGEDYIDYLGHDCSPKLIMDYMIQSCRDFVAEHGRLPNSANELFVWEFTYIGDVP
jgi:hypothetical protein